MAEVTLCAPPQNVKIKRFHSPLILKMLCFHFNICDIPIPAFHQHACKTTNLLNTE